MNLKNSLRNVFRKEEGLFDLSTTDMDKTIEFAKGDFRRFNSGGPVNPLYSAGTGGGTPIGGTSNYRDLSTRQKAQRTSYQIAADKNKMARIGKYGYKPQGPSFVAGSVPYAGETIRGTPSDFYSSDFKKQTGMLANMERAREKPSSSLWETIVGTTNKIADNKLVKNFMDNLRKKYDDGELGGGTPDPYETMKKFRPSQVSARGTPGAQFRARQPNSPVTSQLARAFNPASNSALAKMLMANMGTSGVTTKGLATFADKISVRKPRYVSGTVTPQTVTFTLPTRT